ncbi:hypothetical protein ARMSODRAFT_477623 [Armillaria solidipes]|uniref:Uncharacterized protein n=1 Tax=Armillaria solidipes TaxID=1076256 RepID=A0A2H3BMD9_9AGAR|nr:hypothetical protein ARMSODRAFT_477623 [Armillaria solidipes]
MFRSPPLRLCTSCCVRRPGGFRAFIPQLSLSVFSITSPPTRPTTARSLSKGHVFQGRQPVETAPSLTAADQFLHPRYSFYQTARLERRRVDIESYHWRVEMLLVQPVQGMYEGILKDARSLKQWTLQLLGARTGTLWRDMSRTNRRLKLSLRNPVVQYSNPV